MRVALGGSASSCGGGGGGGGGVEAIACGGSSFDFDVVQSLSGKESGLTVL